MQRNINTQTNKSVTKLFVDDVHHQFSRETQSQSVTAKLKRGMLLALWPHQKASDGYLLVCFDEFPKFLKGGK